MLGFQVFLSLPTGKKKKPVTYSQGEDAEGKYPLPGRV